MNIMTWLIILVLLTSFPVGYLLAYLTREELVQGRFWLKILAIISLILSVILFFVYKNIAIILTLVYIAITSLVSLWKSYDKKFIR